ncbi:oligosaccharide flippase family protein [Ferrimonas pelagia]|uniref:Oligosaccharide flippase family protein n=1 Tax=Ferrimonas pelagia TaxID=1177826 RepID=A0ABP9FIK2_9GAMM
MNAALCYGLAVALTRGVSVVILPWLAHQLTIEAYGQLGLITALAGLGSMLFGCGLAEGSLRFVRSEQQAGQVMALALALDLGLMLALGFTLPVWAGWLPGGLQWHWLALLLLSLAAGSVLGLLQCFARQQGKPQRYLQLAVGQAVLHAGLLLLLVNLGLGISGVLLGGALAALTVAAVALVAFYRVHRVEFNWAFSRRLLAYSGPIAAGAALLWLLNGYERQWIAALAQPQLLAEVALAGQWGLLAALGCEPFNLWWFARRFPLIESGALHSHGRNSMIGVLWLTGSVCITTLLAYGLTPLLFPVALQGALDWVPWFMLLVLLRQLPTLLNLGVYWQQRSHHVFSINALWGVLALLLLPLAGQTDAQAIFSLLAALCAGRAIHIIWLAQWLKPLPYPWWALLPCIATMLLQLAGALGQIPILGGSGVLLVLALILALALYLRAQPEATALC